MELIVRSTATELAELAADRFVRRLAAGPGLVLGLATGSSPLPFYAALATRVVKGDLDLGGIRAFALDEYLGLSSASPQSFEQVLRREVVGPLRLNPAALHSLGAALERDGEDAPAAYERDIVAAGGVDVQILGIGTNGHVGFNEPGSPFDSRTRLVELTDETRRHNAEYFGSADAVPRRAITQGLATIAAARELVLFASGAVKARALAAAVSGPVGAECPASMLQRHPNVVVYADHDAAALVERAGAAPASP